MRVLITASTRLTMMDWSPRSRTSNELFRSAARVGRIDRSRFKPGDGLTPEGRGVMSATRLRSGPALVSALGEYSGRGTTSAWQDYSCRGGGRGRRLNLAASVFPLPGDLPERGSSMEPV